MGLGFQLHGWIQVQINDWHSFSQMLVSCLQKIYIPSDFSFLMKLILSFSKIQKDKEGNVLLFEWLLYKIFFSVFC